MNSISHFVERVRRGVERRLIALSDNPRPDSRPYLSGDGLRALARHVYERGKTDLDGRSVKARDVVFVESGLLEDYVSKVHAHVRNPYILITHNGDKNITEGCLTFLDDRIIRWFAQNALVDHPKITPLPIGLENARFASAGQVRLFWSIKIDTPRNGRILVAFSKMTNPEVREKALKELGKNPLADIYKGKLTQKAYLRLLSKYSYVASPPGNGFDCHRTWEALCVGTVPLVLDSTLNRFFKSMGAPIKIVPDYKTPLSDDERRDIMKTANHEVMSLDYWKSLIENA